MCVPLPHYFAYFGIICSLSQVLVPIHGRGSSSFIGLNIVGCSYFLRIWAIPMPRRRNSELSRELKRAAIEERRVAQVIERELARQQRRVVIQEPRQRAIIQERPALVPAPVAPVVQEVPGPAYAPYAPHDPPQADRPQQIVAPVPAYLARNAGVVARSLSTARRLPTTREDHNHDDDTLQIAADNESDSSE